MGSVFKSLLGSSKDALASEAIQQAYGDQSIDLEQAAEQVAGDEAETVLEQAEAKVEELESGVTEIVQEQDDEDGDADDYEDAAAELADALGMDKEFIMEMVEEARAMQEDMDDYDEDHDDETQADDDDDDDDDYEEMEALVDEKLASLVETELDERLPDGEIATVDHVKTTVQESLEGVASSEELEEQLSNLGESISSDIGEFVEEQMETGSTPGPTGGAAALADLESQAEKWADEITPGEAGGD